MEIAGILLAAGSGSRMGGTVTDKITAVVGGRPVFAHSLSAFAAAGIFHRLVIVYRDARQGGYLREMVRATGCSLPCSFVEGGAERQDSVRHGLAALAGSPTTHVFIHDCARPLVQPAQLRALAALVEKTGAAVLAHRVVDTIKRVDRAAGDPAVHGSPVDLEDLDRKLLWAMETPQAFRHDWIREAYASLAVPVTDDVAALTEMGHKVAMLENPHPNPKITRASDLKWVEFILESANPSRA